MVKVLVLAAALMLSPALAEPPKDKQDTAKKQEKIEIAVEKLERTKKRTTDPQDADGDGYGDTKKRAGDPIPGIDITVNQSPGLPPPPPPPPPPAVGTGDQQGAPKAQLQKDRAKAKTEACKADPKNC